MPTRTQPFVAPPAASACPSWREEEAAAWATACADPRLGHRIYTSRLIGSDPALALAGGGNTSVKGTVRGLFGEALEALWIKASGADLATLEPHQLCALHLARVLRLLTLDRLADADLRRELLAARVDPEAPAPSVETLLHAFLPFRFVDHAHPDAILTLTQTPDGRARAERLYGTDCVVVPYARPGFELALAARRHWERAVLAGARPRGLLLLHHGLFTFADEARASYEALVELTGRAAARLPRRLPRPRPRPERAPPTAWSGEDLAGLRAELSRAAGRPLVAHLDAGAEALAFAAEPDVRTIANRGPLTPDHLLRTRRAALVVGSPRRAARAVAGFADRYRREVERRRGDRSPTPLDPAPRIVVIPGTGILAAGSSAREALAASALYARTARAIRLAERLGGWRPLAAAHCFDFEHAALAEAQAGPARATGPLAGRVALVTGAAGRLGRACVEALRAAGAAVAAVDRRPIDGAEDLLALVADGTSPPTVAAAAEAAVRHFGGLDLVVDCGAELPPDRALDEARGEESWRRAFAVLAEAHLRLLGCVAPLLRRSPCGGAAVMIGSHGTLAPAAGAAAHSAARAELCELARVAASELAPIGVRINVVHAGACVEVAPADIAAAAVALATDAFRATTGVLIPIDGSSDRVR